MDLWPDLARLLLLLLRQEVYGVLLLCNSLVFIRDI